VELGLVEQRYAAVLEVLNDGATVTDVARRNGVSRQAVHEWLRKYASHGLAGLVDHSSKPQSCPHQMDPVVEARIVELRLERPGWGPRTIEHRLGNEGIDPLPGRTSIYRCLVRHGLITPQARRRKRADYKRWERTRAMELWQMDVVGGVRIADGAEAKVITGVDDHSRFCVSGLVVTRATARPTCDALAPMTRDPTSDDPLEGKRRLLGSSEHSLDVIEETVDLLGIELRGTAMSEVNGGIDERGRLPAWSRPPGTLQLGAEDILDGEPPGAAGIEHRVQGRLLVLTMPSH